MKVGPYVRKTLADLGLSEGEADVLFPLLKLAAPMTADHIRQEAKLSTSGTYKVLRSLVDKEFILPTKEQGTKKYAAITLEQIAEKLVAHSRKYLRASEKLREIGRLSGLSPETDIIEGTALSDYYLTIPSQIDDFIWCVGSFAAVMHFFGPEIERSFIAARLKKGRHADAVIFDDSLFSKELAGRDIGERRETKLIPHGSYPLEFSYLFGNTCLDFYKNPEGQVKVLKSESPSIARARLIQYQTLWNSTAR